LRADFASHDFKVPCKFKNALAFLVFFITQDFGVREFDALIQSHESIPFLFTGMTYFSCARSIVVAAGAISCSRVAIFRTDTASTAIPQRKGAGDAAIVSAADDRRAKASLARVDGERGNLISAHVST
jgi:hypothetical protein